MKAMINRSHKGIRGYLRVIKKHEADSVRTVSTEHLKEFKGFLYVSLSDIKRAAFSTGISTTSLASLSVLIISTEAVKM